MDFSFGIEEKALADSFRDFIKREVKPLEDTLRPIFLESDGDAPELREELLKIRRRSAELGFYSLDIPTELGGGGLSYVGQALMREVAGASGSFLAIACLSGPEGPTGLIQGMKPALRDRLVPPFLRAEISAAFGLTEPDAGSDNQSMKTRAVKDGDDWVINGTKHFITNGQHADFIQLFAVTDQEKKAAGGVTCFVVEKGTPGFSVGKSQAVIGDGEGPCELVFEDCRVPDENVIGEVGMGFYAAMQFLTGGRANIGAMCVGIADYLLRCLGRVRQEPGAVRQADRQDAGRFLPARRHGAGGGAGPFGHIQAGMAGGPGRTADPGGGLLQALRHRDGRACRRHRDPGPRRDRADP